jgi:hypothetical protein
MSLVWHQIKKDGWRLRWLLVLWAVLVVLQSGLLVASALVTQGWAAHLAYKLVAMVLPLLQFLLLVLIVPLLVHEEPLVGTTAASFTRPLSRGTLLASRPLSCSSSWSWHPWPRSWWRSGPTTRVPASSASPPPRSR